MKTVPFSMSGVFRRELAESAKNIFCYGDSLVTYGTKVLPMLFLLMICMISRAT